MFQIQEVIAVSIELLLTNIHFSLQLPFINRFFSENLFRFNFQNCITMRNFLKIKFLLCPLTYLINCVTHVLISALYQFIDDGEFLFPSQTFSSVLLHTSCCLHYNYSTGRSILRVPCPFWPRDLITTVRCVAVYLH